MTAPVPAIPPPNVQPDGPSLAELMTALPVATLVIAPDNVIFDANVWAETLLNMARSAIVGSDVTRTIRMAEAGARFDIWHSNKPIAAYDIKVHAGRTAEMEVDLMIAPIIDHEGWRIISIHAQSHARKIGHRGTTGGARSAIGAAAILAHEIKNPLSGIRGAAQLLESGNEGHDTTLTQLICNEVDRIAALIDRMQDFTTDRTLECRPGNIYPLIDRAVNIAAAGFAKDVRIIRRYDPSLPFAIINDDALVQVMINLIKNAAEALENVDEGWIRVETAFRHGVSVVMGEGKGSAVLPIEILIVDNGPGVPDHILDHLFNPFITGKRDGQGLGLALVDKLVRDMNGFVQYSRDREAGESTFRILLPMGMG
ncbi:two-component system sensor histidine kinase NtrB [Sphingobium vermicomposti]|uniref:histidine kinase n=1 Tax=Sphingobium vermicomposti TaxID=529005 RepID=A0A846M7A7_9SPHN|nr:ATP-binding protein [Sphingobium vermicomposti]NIJ16580.1 two-component system nitrogen regulation sensor histidine kinase GlnL [Sphingobium vermicomposti]